MKKKLFLPVCFFLISVSNIYAQTIKYNHIPQNFRVEVDYEILNDCNTYNFSDDSEIVTITNTLGKKNTIVTKETYEYILGVDYLMIDNYLLVNTLDYKIHNNDCFPSKVIYSIINREKCDRWIPIWYFDALKKQDRDLILKGESKRESWDGDITPDVWYKEIPQVSSFILTNAGMTYYTPLWGQIVFLFQFVKNVSETKYEVVAYPDVEATDNDITWDVYRENFPHIENGNPVKFIIEINGREMKVYNGETKKICFDLIQESAEWVRLYETFIRTNNVPAGLDLPKEYLDRSIKK